MQVFEGVYGIITLRTSMDIQKLSDKNTCDKKLPATLQK